MKINMLYTLFIATVIFSSCTTLQQRRVADELYDIPDRETVQMSQSERYGDTIDKRSSDRYRDNYGYHPGYNGYLPPRYYHDWYYRDFHPYHSPFYGYGYPWYNSWYGYGSAFYGLHYYGYRPWYGYSYYYPNYYPVNKRTIQRKSAQNSIYNRNRQNSLSIHSGRIRKTERTKDNRLLLENPNIRVTSDGRKSSVPQRTTKALDGKKSVPDIRKSSQSTGKYIRPSATSGSSNRKYNVIRQDHRRSSPTIHRSRTSPVYRQPSRSVNRIHHTQPARPVTRSSGNRK